MDYQQQGMMPTVKEQLHEMGYMVTMIQSLLLELTQEMDDMRHEMLQKQLRPNGFRRPKETAP
eukprot:scaffold52547_cov57-Attheya_sp.AAC.4